MGLGGFLGAIARHSVVLLIKNNYLTRLPMGTLAVNVLGCGLMGVLWSQVESLEGSPTDSPLYLILATGFLGAFTTFSAFSLDTVLLFETSGASASGLNVFLNVVLCLAAFVCGRFLMA